MKTEVDEKTMHKSIEEGLMPELKDDVKIKIGDKEINITEMPIFYVRQLNRKLEPIYGLISGATSTDQITASLLNMESIDTMYDTMSEVALLILDRYDKDINKDWLEKNASEKQIFELITRQLEVNGLVDFLKSVLREMVNMIARTPLKTGLEGLSENML